MSLLVLRCVSLRRAGVLVVCMLAGLACVGGSSKVEVGADACSDGLDNDGDGKIDCADEGCRSVSFCAVLDFGIGIVDASAQRDTSLDNSRDQGLPRDQAGERRPDSSYGRRCSFPSGASAPTLCPDKFSLCVPAPLVAQSPGFCTARCASATATCKAPSGFTAACDLVGANFGERYCGILCPTGKCPFDTKCYQNEHCF